MSERQWKRWDVVARLNAGKVTVTEAATMVGLSARQLRRIRQRLRIAGRAGLRHGNRGRAPANKVAAATQVRVVELRQTKYAGVNDCHFAEKLATETPPLHLSPATIRRMLRAAGIGSMWRRRPRRHHRRRDRKPQRGRMLPWDGSRHAWLEDRGPLLTLVGAIDDASSELLPGAHFVEQECAAAYVGLLHTIATECGLPASIYMDQRGARKRNDVSTQSRNVRFCPPRSSRQSHWPATPVRAAVRARRQRAAP